MRRICVYCGANPGGRPEYLAAARAMAAALLERDLGLVFGGGVVGLMGEVADAMLAGGGEVIGVIPQALLEKEVRHPRVRDLRVVSSMHERKATMAELSDGFVALPGGLGTLEELLEVLTWNQLGFISKPCAVLDVAGYFRGLQSFLDHAVLEQFIRPLHREMLLVERDPGALLEQMHNWRAPGEHKWLRRDPSPEPGL
jgi:uncharacterized protein (TIGR00730 family)